MNMQLSSIEGDLLSELHELKLRIVNEGHALLDLSMVNPDLAPPRVMLDRLVEGAAKTGQHRYSVSRGVRRLREAFAAKYASKFQVTLDPEHQICVCLGTKDAVLHTLMTVGSPGDSAVLVSPAYPVHRAAARIAGYEVDTVTLGSCEEHFVEAMTEKLRKRRFKVAVLNFPNNPTGMTLSRHSYERLLPAFRDNGCVVINDFVYGELSFDAAPACSILSVEGYEAFAVESYSLSKAYNVPGWRIGAMAGARAVIERLMKLKSNIDYGQFMPLQVAAAAALASEEDLTAPTRQAYAGRTSLLARGLRSQGWSCESPAAGACIWARLPESVPQRDAARWCRELLAREWVSVLPGAVFGPEYADHVRFAAVLPGEGLHEVLLRLARLDEMRDGASAAWGRAVPGESPERLRESTLG